MKEIFVPHRINAEEAAERIVEAMDSVFVTKENIKQWIVSVIWDAEHRVRRYEERRIEKYIYDHPDCIAQVMKLGELRYGKKDKNEQTENVAADKEKNDDYPLG